MGLVQKYKEYSPADKAALKELTAEAAAKLGVSQDGPDKLKITEMVAAVEPLEDTPERLKGL